MGIGLSSVAATSLGTDVSSRWRGGASGIVNTAAQVGTAVGVAALLLIAAVTSGVPAAGGPAPDAAWAVGAAAAAAGAAWFARVVVVPAAVSLRDHVNALAGAYGGGWRQTGWDPYEADVTGGNTGAHEAAAGPEWRAAVSGIQRGRSDTVVV